jgi:hypothetical protein
LYLFAFSIRKLPERRERISSNETILTSTIYNPA